MMRETGVDETVSDVIGVVAESSCRYYAEVSFPGSVDVGVRVARIGRTSAVLELGLFVAGTVEIAAHGEWVQVYIDRLSRRPVPIPDVVRAHLERSRARREPRAGRGDGAGPA
jgi:acyl-CoA thioester hydrolase